MSHGLKTFLQRGDTGGSNPPLRWNVYYGYSHILRITHKYFFLQEENSSVERYSYPIPIDAPAKIPYNAVMNKRNETRTLRVFTRGVFKSVLFCSAFLRGE
jgi:hypothetical protein